MDAINNKPVSAEVAISPVSPVTPSATILQGLNEKFALLQPGQSLSARVLQRSGNHVLIQTELGDLLLWTNSRLKLGEEVFLSRLNNQDGLKFELKTSKEPASNLVEDRIVITNHENQIWQSKTLTINMPGLVAYLRQAQHLLSELKIPLSELEGSNLSLLRRLRLGLRLVPKSLASTTNKAAFSYQIESASDKETIIKTPLGLLQVLGRLPSDLEWELELAKLMHLPVENFSILDSSSLQKLESIFRNNWPNLQQFYRARSISSNFNSSSLHKTLSDIVLMVAKRKAKGYYHWLTEEMEIGSPSHEFEELLLEARTLDEYNNTQTQCAFILPNTSYRDDKSFGEWIKLYIKEDKEEGRLIWQIEWSHKALGDIQLVVKANKVIANNTNWASMFVELYSLEVLAPSLREQLSAEFGKLCKDYDLWGEISFKEGKVASIAQQIVEEGLKPSAGLVV